MIWFGDCTHRLNVMLTKLTQAEKELGLPDATQQDLTSMDKVGYLCLI